MISETYFISHLLYLSPWNPINQSVANPVCVTRSGNRQCLLSSWLTEQWERQEVWVCESAFHPCLLQGGPGPLQRNAWEWASSLKPPLLQGPWRLWALLLLVSLAVPLSPSGLLLAPLHFKCNGFTLSLRMKNKQAPCCFCQNEYHQARVSYFRKYVYCSFCPYVTLS